MGTFQALLSEQVPQRLHMEVALLVSSRTEPEIQISGSPARLHPCSELWAVGRRYPETPETAEPGNCVKREVRNPGGEGQLTPTSPCICACALCDLAGPEVVLADNTDTLIPQGRFWRALGPLVKRRGGRWNSCSLKVEMQHRSDWGQSFDSPQL